MKNFLLSTASQVEIENLDGKIHETVDTINQLKINREFFLSFAKNPQQFINKWIVSQTRDLKVSCTEKSDVMRALFHKLTLSVDNDRCRWQSRRRTSSRILLPKLVSRSRLPLFLHQSATKESRIGAGAEYLQPLNFSIIVHCIDCIFRLKLLSKIHQRSEFQYFASNKLQLKSFYE